MGPIIREHWRALLIALVDAVFLLAFLALASYAVVTSIQGRSVHPALVIIAGCLGLTTGAAATAWRVTYVKARAIRDAQDNATP